MWIGVLFLLAGPPETPGGPFPQPDARSQVRVSTDHGSDRLRVELRANGETFKCPELVATDRPCVVANGPTGWLDLSIDGSRRFSQAIELLPGPNTIRVGHRSYGPAFAGALLVGAGIAFVALGGPGPTITESSDTRLYWNVGAVACSLGTAIILYDFLRQHDFAAVTNP